MTESNEHLTPMPHTANNHCFGCGPANETGIHLEFLVADDKTVVCVANIPERFEGVSGYLHGGIIATLLDEAMSKSIRAQGLMGMTRHMEVDYKRPVHSGAPIRIEGRLVRSEDHKHWAEARIHNGNGSVLAASKGLFVEIRPRLESHKPRTHTTAP